MDTKRFLLSMLVVLSLGLTGLWASASVEVRPIRIAIMPDADSLPFMLAQADNLYRAEGVAVELVPFQSPVERDAAFQAGRIDGMVGDTLGALFLEQAGFDITITSITNGRYGLAASPQGTLTSLAQLGDVPIAISTNTIIEYVTDALVASAGVPRERFKTVAVPKIPVRIELLLNGGILAACLPEPNYTLAVAKGARPLGDSGSLYDAPGVMIFTASFVGQRSTSLAAFYRAYWKAAQNINADPDKYRSFLIEKAGFPEAVRETYRFVTYTPPSVPSEDQVQRVVDWMVGKKLLDTVPAYADLVDDSIVKGL
ncbi:MAG: ABC transporter substrate-binding protein [Sphaerochaetaceae bacterium]